MDASQLYCDMTKTFTDRPTIFNNYFYERCFYAALGSGCKKMKFGCIIAESSRIVAETANTPLEPLVHLCEPSCIRQGIVSRRESMIGACAHAEELAMDLARVRGAHLPDCDLYIAGFYLVENSDRMTPWLHSVADHTCIRCSTQMYRARIKRIYVPTSDGWLFTTAEEACRQSAQYAMGEKSV